MTSHYHDITQEYVHEWKACLLFTASCDYWVVPRQPWPKEPHGILWGANIPHIHAAANMLEVEETTVVYSLSPTHLQYDTTLGPTREAQKSGRSPYSGPQAEFDENLPDICKGKGVGIFQDAVQEAYRICPPASSEIPRQHPFHDAVIHPEPKSTIYLQPQTPTSTSEADHSPASPSASPSKGSKRSSRRFSWKILRPSTPSSH